MRVEVSPLRLSAVPGRPTVITVRVVNDGTLISGHRIRVLGIDPAWASLDRSQVSLFPDASATVVLTVTLPRGIPAGVRRLDVEVSELTPPAEVSVSSVELSVPAETDLRVSLDPTSTTGGSSAVVGVLVDNVGNAEVEATLAGKDAESQVDFSFAPVAPLLAPGEQVLASARLSAPRPWFGSPKVRPFTVEVGPREAPVVAQGAWVQRPRLSRGAIALTGLLAALTVFAVVIAVALSSVVGQSDANRNLALQVAAAAENHGAPVGTASIAGVVSELTTGARAAGVTVVAYLASNTANPVVSTSTDAAGAYRFQGLPAGTYKLRFDGAGFTELWYPESLDPATARGVQVGAGQDVSGIDVYLGGLPATVSGQVSGPGATGALLSLDLPGGSGASGGSGTALTAESGPPPASAGAVLDAATTPAPPPGAVVVMSETIGASGTFSFVDVPSPAVYDLVLTKPGFATTTQEIDLSGGETRSGLVLAIDQGDGSLSGSVTSSSGAALGDATVSALAGASTLTTVTETTTGHVGDFSLADLATPSSLTLVVSDAGYASQTIAVSLTADQQLSGIRVVLSPGVGSISGVVATPVGSPAGGVTVTATNGRVTLSTVTLSIGQVGSYRFSGLSVPDTYTLTFSRPDLTSQTLAVSLPEGSVTSVGGVDVTMTSATASIYGVLSELCPSPSLPGPAGTAACVPGGGAANVTVSLTAGGVSYSVATASTAADGHPVGYYALAGITPGTYTLSFTRPGGVPQSQVVDLGAGAVVPVDLELPAAAAIFGYVDIAGHSGQPATGAQVSLYLADQYPTVALASVTLTAADDGEFEFQNLQAPDAYIVAVAYPADSSTQETVQVTTALSTTSAACGSNATGEPAQTGSGTLTCSVATASSDPLEVVSP